MDSVRFLHVRRPILAGASGLVAGALAGSVGAPFVGGLAGVAGSVGCIAAMIAFRRSAFLSAAGLIGAFFFAGALYWEARDAGRSGDAFAYDVAEHPEGSVYELEGRIVAADIWLPDAEYLTARLDVNRVTRGGETVEVDGGTLLRWSEPAFGVHVGDRVRVRGSPSLALAHVNPGTAGPEAHYRRRGVHTAVRLYGGDSVEVQSRAPWYDAWAGLSRFRGMLAARLSRAIPPETLPFVLTVWLGDRRQIDSELYQKFVESGTAHVLSVSGLHVAIIFTSLRLLMRMAVRRRRVRLTVLLLSVAAVVGMTGAQVATIRATLMIAIYLAAEWFEREPDAPTALAIAAATFVVYDPNVLYDVAFQLSFLSVGSLLLFDSAIAEAIERLPFGLREASSATLAVQLLPLPVAVHAFHVLPLAAPLANLAVIPLTGVVLWLGFLASVCALVFPAAAPIFGHAIHPVVQFILWIASAVSEADFAFMHVISPTPAALAAYGAAMAAAYVASRRPAGMRVAWAGGAVLAGIACLVLWSPLRAAPEVTVLDVGHGDSIFVRAPGGATMLVDAGQRSEYVDEGRRTVAPFLWSNHESKLDVLMVTHPDSDHVGGAKYVLEQFRVGTVVLGPQPHPGTMEDEIIALCERRGVPVTRLATGDWFALGGARIEVLHPPRDLPADTGENDRSLVARVTWPGMSALLTGDIERVGEELLLTHAPHAAVLKVPHHGSITSSSPAFIDAVGPSVAVISTGPRGRTNVLNPAVVARYEERGIHVFRTDIVGGVRMRPGPDGLHVLPARLERGYITRGQEAAAVP